MNTIKTQNAAILIAILLITLFLSGCTGNNNNNNNNNDDSSNYIESFEFTGMNGNVINTSEYEGKIVLIDLFGVRCTPCQYQMIVLDEIYKNYDESDVVIISIDVWMMFGETPALIEQFIDEYEEVDIHLDWVFGYDDESGTIYNQYVEQGIPTLIILDKNGNIYYRNAGYTAYSYLANKIDELL